MEMISRKGMVALALGIAPLTLAATACGDSDSAAEDASVKIFTLTSLDDSGVSGTVKLIQNGGTVSTTVDLKGFQPGTAHAMHLHGEATGTFGCDEDDRTSNHLIDFPDVEADDDGDVDATFDYTLDGEAGAEVVKDGTYVMVHAVPNGETLEPGEEVTAGSEEVEEDGGAADEAMADDEAMAEDDAMVMEEDGAMAEGDAMEEDGAMAADGDSMVMEEDGAMEDMDGMEDDGHSHTHGDNPPVACGPAT